MDQQNTYQPQSPIQQNQTPSSIPPINTTSVSYNSEKNRKFGPIIAISIIILVVIIVAIYLFASQIGPSTTTQDSVNTGANIISATPDQNTNTTVNATPQTIAPVSNTADDVNSLQKDLDSSIQGIDTQSI